MQPLHFFYVILDGTLGTGKCTILSIMIVTRGNPVVGKCTLCCVIVGAFSPYMQPLYFLYVILVGTSGTGKCTILSIMIVTRDNPVVGKYTLRCVIVGAFSLYMQPLHFFYVILVGPSGTGKCTILSIIIVTRENPVVGKCTLCCVIVGAFSPYMQPLHFFYVILVGTLGTGKCTILK